MDNHPTMTNPGITSGNGFMLYFRTENMDAIYKSALGEGWKIEEDIQLNPGPMKREFSLRDPDGYFLTTSEFHEFEK
ncbi:hypothetical protein NT017_02880 [Prolixibacter sp. NT017]|nr:hypothetical protein NT017_02880 [Prolixibacter sp. NT017]